MNTDPDIEQAVLPSLPTLEQFDTIFAKLHGQVSDIMLQPDMPMVVRYKTHLVRASKHPLSEKGLSGLLESMVGDRQKALAMSGEPIDWSHRLFLQNNRYSHSQSILSDGEGATFGPELPGQQILRFRCNAQSVQTRYSSGQPMITMRPNPYMPMNIKDLHLPAKLRKGLFPSKGLVLFVGPTGSGKTTTLGAVMREHVYNRKGLRICTIEEPIEYNLHVLDDPYGFVTHSEIGRNVNTFPLAIRAAMRQNPDVLMVGEMRDVESMLIASEAANTGHIVYSTIHANGVADVFNRICQKLEQDNLGSSVQSIISASKAFVYQRLYRGLQGQVVPVLEYVVFSMEDSRRLIEAYRSGGIAGVELAMLGIIKRSGRAYLDSARDVFHDGKIGKELFGDIETEFHDDNAIVLNTEGEITQ